MPTAGRIDLLVRHPLLRESPHAHSNLLKGMRLAGVSTTARPMVLWLCILTHTPVAIRNRRRTAVGATATAVGPLWLCIMTTQRPVAICNRRLAVVGTTAIADGVIPLCNKYSSTRSHP